MISIKHYKFLDLEKESTFLELVSEYAMEGSIEGIPNDVQYNTYRVMDSAGVLRCLGVYIDDIFAGFAIIMVSILPHHGVKTAIVDSIFIAKAHRNTLAGIKLINDIENIAINENLSGVLYSTPSDGPLTHILEHKKYREIGKVFFGIIKNE
jgi:hypothetical protein